LNAANLPDFERAATGSHFFQHGNGLRQHYLDVGRGPPVVMLHGNPSWCYYWRHLCNGLADRYRCIVPDHIGMGWSDKPDSRRYGYRLQDRINDLDALLARVVPEGPVTLAVHDWGGMIGMGWALLHPERVNRVIFLNTAAFPKPPGKRLPASLGLVRNTSLGAWLVERLNFFAWGATRLGVTRPMSPAVKAAYLSPYDTPANRIGTLRFVQDIPLQPGEAGYSTLVEAEALLARFRELPVFIGWGLKDFVFDHHFLARFRELLPNAEVHALADAGHYVLEDAHERLVPAIRSFLDRHGG
jgi:pimeloyl-ACP methyl ester carboxylesterase